MNKINRTFFILLSMMLVVGCQSNYTDTTETQMYSYSPEQYTTVSIEDGENRYYVQSLSDLEERVAENSFGLIAIVEVAGDSINRIIETREEERNLSKIYGVNHVLTPIKLVSIIYSGDNVSLKDGDEVYLKEPFFYITKATPEYLEIYGASSIIADEYEPLEKGKIYVMFLSYEPSEIYDYEGQTTLRPMGLREAFYAISDQSVSKSVAGDKIYQKIWQEVKQKYGETQ